MKNAKEEIIKHINDRKVIYVAIENVSMEIDIDIDNGGVTENIKNIKGTIEEVLPLLDFQYDNGFGYQEVYGTIWYADGTWSERESYDGKEWWVHRVRPELPDNSTNNNNNNN